VRAFSVPADIVGAVHEHRFRQFVREGAAAPAFLLSDYSAGRRRAMLVASLIDLETRLSDAAMEMFDKLVGSLFTRAKRGQERRYQATARDVGQLMRLFGRTIAALSEAREGEADALAVVDEAIGWHRLLAAKPQVDALAKLAGEDMLVSAAERYATIRRFAPAFLNAFSFHSPRSGTSLMQAVEDPARPQPPQPTRGAGQRAATVPKQAVETARARGRTNQPPALRDRGTLDPVRLPARRRCLDRGHPQLPAFRRLPVAQGRSGRGRRKTGNRRLRFAPEFRVGSLTTKP